MRLSPILHATLVLAATAACNLDGLCTVHETRCDGGYAQECIKTGSGFGVGPIDEKQTYQRSTPTYYWESTDCGAPELCVVGTSGRAMCVLGADASQCLPSAPDTSVPDGGSCDQASSLRCSDGFVVEERACSACNRDGGCGGRLSDSCDDSRPCAAGLSCLVPVDGGSHLCTVPCSCPEGVACPSCAPFHRRAAGYASTLVMSCHAGFCLE